MTQIQSEVDTLRREWIALLRSGKYKQGNGMLARVSVSWLDGGCDYQLDMVDCEHCCIGVYCANRLGAKFYNSLIPSWDAGQFTDREIELDDARHYDLWEEELQVTAELKQYLMAMNDGNRLWTDFERTVFGTGFSDSNTIPYRNNAEERSFEFIARFLEIVWGLSAR